MTEANRLRGRHVKASDQDPKSLVSVFVGHCIASPDAPALLGETRSYSYSELLTAAEKVAGRLLDADVQPGDLVGLYAHRSVDAVIAMLGILRTGAAYVPLDPTHAPEHLGFIAEDLALSTVLVADTYKDQAPLHVAKETTLIPMAEALANDPGDRDWPTPVGEDVAYVMYTSGTTGQPKGVVIPHRAVVAHCHGQSCWQMTPDDVVLHALTIACDGSTFDLWAGLLNGASVAVVEAANPSLDDIAKVIKDKGVTAITWYAGVHHLMIDHDLSAFENVRLNISGGDVMSAEHAARLLTAWPDIRLINAYGPTEATVCALRHQVSMADLDGGAVPIGVPYDNYDAFVVDEGLKPLPSGETGQLVLAGKGIGLGYHNRPEKTAEVFVEDPREGKSGTVYLTGDLATARPDGVFLFTGRTDRQVKIGGRRVELDGLEHTLRGCAGVRDVAVVVVKPDAGSKRIAAVILAEGEIDQAAHKDFLRGVMDEAAQTVNDATLPRMNRVWADFPMTPAGKIDRNAIAERLSDELVSQGSAPPQAVDMQTIGDTRAIVFGVWNDILQSGPLDDDVTFFEAGGTSLQLIDAHARIERALGRRFPITDVFETPRLGDLAAKLAALQPVKPAVAGPSSEEPSTSSTSSDLPEGAIAIVGMAARLPGADSLSDFWGHIQRGDNLIPHFSDDELDDFSDAATRADPSFVRARPVVEAPEMFDAKFFGILPREAELMDPQARIFLELCQHALEDAGIDPSRPPGAIGVFGGSSPSTYLLANLMTDRAALETYTTTYQLGNYNLLTGNSTDSLVTRVAHKLDLKGPAIAMGTACSTSLTTISQAVQSLRAGQMDAALAGGVSISFPQHRGYLTQEGGMAAADGVCRPFDADAGGTVFGNGAGVVVLRRLEDAVAAGDPIYAVIRGVGQNNDGADKISYTAPSVEGQANAIRLAHRDARVDPQSISYLECHGTATPLGDPIEISGLKSAFGPGEEESVALGSVKGNIGHLDAAAGVLSVIKTAMMLRAAVLPPVANFKALNPRIDLENSPFYVPDAADDWVSAGPRRAGVSSFGVGGTNAHIVMEEAPLRTDKPVQGMQILPLSAKSPEALMEMAGQLADALEADQAPTLGAAARTLQDGRKTFPWRMAVAASDAQGAVERLRAAKAPSKRCPDQAPGVVFMFPGQGSQYPGMGQGLYEALPEFANWIDQGAEILTPIIGQDMTALLTRSDLNAEEAAKALRDTRLTQPALFMVQYACAQVWRDRGIVPEAMIGHSVGEFTAAALAGVMDFETGLRIIARRGQLMQDQPGGAMLSVRAPIEDLEPHLAPDVDIAGMNAPRMQVVAGSFDAISALEHRLETAGIAAKRLHTSHAFHSAMMDPVVTALEQEISGITLRAPAIPIVSSVTGDWLDDAAATEASFWAKQARAAVNFQAAVKVVCEGAPKVLIEQGAGGTLSAFATQTLGRGGHGGVFQSLSDHTRVVGDIDAMASAYANLWAAGLPVDWSKIGPRSEHRVSLPGTAFQRRRFWVDPPARAIVAPESIEVAPAIAAEAVVCDESESLMSTPTAEADRAARLSDELLAMFSELSGEDLGPDDTDVPFLELGFDSLFMGQVSQRLGKTYGVEMTFRSLLSDTPSVAALAAHLDTLLPAEAAPTSAPIPAQAPTPVPAAAPQAAATAAPVQAGQMPAAPAVSAAGQDAVTSLMQAQMQTMQALFADQLRALGGAAPTKAPQQPAPATVQAVPVPTAANASPTAATATTDAPEAAKPQAFKTGRGPNLAGAELNDEQRAFASNLAQRYTAKFGKSKAYTAENRDVLADPRTASGFRPEWKELTFPIVVDRASGAYLDDIDGNRFVDLVNGFGQTAFGHSPDFVSKAVTAQLERGYPIGPQSDTAGPIAKKFAAMTGHARVTFCNTGSEAVMAAMRLARAVTGREKIAIFSGDYHGQFDEVLVKGKSRGGAPAALPIAPGIPRSGLANMVVLPYGTDDTLAWIRDNIEDLAAVIVEPVQSRHPDHRPVAFVREVQQIAQTGGAAFVMDEVVTGFRTHNRGMQGVWDIQPDMATYGKVVGGGMPIGVLAGKQKFMDALDGGTWAYGDDSKPEVAPTFFAGTFVRHPLVLAAVDAVLDHLNDEGASALTATAERTADLVAKMRAALAARGLPDLIECYSSWFVLNVSEHDPRATLLYALMRLNGVHIIDGYCGFLTTAHTEADAQAVLQAFEAGLDELQSVGILTGDVSGEAAIPVQKTVLREAPTKAVPLSESQQEIWMTHQLGDLPACSFNEGVSLRLDGDLDPAALQSALDDIVARHDALRMKFDRSGTSFDVLAPYALDLPLHDVSAEDNPEQAFQDFLQDDAKTPVDITAGPPIRAALVRLGAQSHVLVLTTHHIACDGWSYGVIFEDLVALYTAKVGGADASLAAAPSFAAHAQAENAKGPNAATQAFWKAQFETVPPLPELPTDAPRSAVKSFAGATAHGTVPLDEVKALRKAGAKQGCTLFASLFAAMQMTLGRLSGAQDLVIGVPTGGQALLEDQNLVGHLVNFLPIRGEFALNEPVAEHLKRVSATLFNAFDHQDTTYGALVRELNIERSLNRLPLTEVQFNLERQAEGLSMGGVTVRPETNAKAAVNFDLFFNLVESSEGLRVDVDYNADLYAKETVERWIGHFRTMLGAIAADSSRNIGDLDMMSPEGLTTLLDGQNATEMAFDRSAMLQDLVAQSVAAHPEAIAIEDAAGETSYAALAADSDAIAAKIQSHLPNPGARVAVALPRGAPMLAALLGVLKAGHTYVPLDPSQPDGRLRQIVETARVAGILSDVAAPGFAAGLDVVGMDIADVTAGQTPEAVPCDPEAPAYVIFTSGSTGTPKGVEIPHRALVNFLTTMAQEPGLTAQDTLLSVTTVMFDIAVLELFGPLIVGGKVIIADRAQILDGFQLVKRIDKGDVTLMQATPTLWSMLLDAGLKPASGLKLLAGGEPLPDDLAARLVAGGAELWNMYGPTETTIWSAVQRIEPGAAITIGHPIGNTELHILDEEDRILPMGAVGELNIGGDGLALGYFDRPDLTEAAFRTVALGGQQRRLYRTGDLAQRLSNGDIRVLGRKDTQVKLRGFRIELGEIETRLRAQPDVAAAAVDVRTRKNGDKRLVAYLVAAEGKQIDQGALASALGRDLPDYMVPQGWVTLSALPQTGNGKLDRKALPDPDETAHVTPLRAAEAPETATEKRIAAIWADVLGLQEVGVTDTLYTLGADSLVVFRIAAKMLDDGLNLEARHVLMHPTIRELASFADGRDAEGTVPARPSLRDFRKGARRTTGKGA